MRNTILFILLSVCAFSKAQIISEKQIPKDFKKLTDSILKRKPFELSILEKTFESYSKDCDLLEFLEKESRKKGYKFGEIFSELAMGQIHIYNGEYRDAEQHFTEALINAKQIENLFKRIQSFNEIGYSFMEIESIKNALDSFGEALYLGQTLTNPSVEYKLQINRALSGIGEVYHLLEQYDLAASKFQEALRSDIELNNLEGMAKNYQNLGRSNEGLGNNSMALEYYSKSQEINSALQNRQFGLTNIAKIAHLKTHSGKEEEGFYELLSILSEVEATSDPELRARVNNSIGCVLNRLGNYSDARKFLYKGLAISEDIPLPRNIDVANTLLYQNFKATENFKQAMLHLEAAESARAKLSRDMSRQYVYEVISNAQAEQRQEIIDAITRENELVNLQLKRNQTAMMVGGLLFILFAFLLYFLYRQFQLNNDKKFLSMEQRILRSQMNPHFLFNALNAIKLYIIKNDQNNAINYLNKFSKLIRNILETSAQKEITLQEELETVMLYMNIENIRFNNSIEFTVEIDEKLDTSQIKIPSLILQPFLENALWHGLSLKEGNKSLKLGVQKVTEGSVNITIEDNGIGRVAASEIKENRILKRRSYGIAITRERLAIFSKTFQNRFAINMQDLFNSDGSSAGTLVTLNIPTS
jgi:tetratricopeptide (TPR) repeat protein